MRSNFFPSLGPVILSNPMNTFRFILRMPFILGEAILRLGSHFHSKYLNGRVKKTNEPRSNTSDVVSKTENIAQLALPSSKAPSKKVVVVDDTEPNGATEEILSQYQIEGGRSACGAISTLAAIKMLDGSLRKETINDTLRHGVTLYKEAKEWLATSFGFDEPGEYLSVDHCLAGTELGEKARFSEKGGLPQGVEILLNARETEFESFCRLLLPIQERAEDRGSVVAAVVTLVPETISISYDPIKKEWTYFNSHGNNLEYGTGALLISFKTVEEVALLMAKSKSFIDSCEAVNQDINRCVMYMLTPKIQPLSKPAEPDYVGNEQLVEKHCQQLREFEKWARTDFSEFSRNHYDWWMFPIDRTSQGQQGKYTVYKDQIELLKTNPFFMENYRKGARLLLASWGWDEKRRCSLDNGQRFDGHLVRLGKLVHSLALFGENELLSSAQEFAKGVVRSQDLTSSRNYLRTLIY